MKTATDKFDTVKGTGTVIALSLIALGAASEANARGSNGLGQTEPSGNSSATGNCCDGQNTGSGSGSDNDSIKLCYLREIETLADGSKFGEVSVFGQSGESVTVYVTADQKTGTYRVSERDPDVDDCVDGVQLATPKNQR